jgi:hypothetical protein
VSGWHFLRFFFKEEKKRKKKEVIAEQHTQRAGWKLYKNQGRRRRKKPDAYVMRREVL